MNRQSPGNLTCRGRAVSGPGGPGRAPEARCRPIFTGARCGCTGQDVLLKAAQVTGERGVEIYAPADAVGLIWDALLAQKAAGESPPGWAPAIRCGSRNGLPAVRTRVEPEHHPGREPGFRRLVRRTGGDEFVGAGCAGAACGAALGGLRSRRAAGGARRRRVWDVSGQNWRRHLRRFWAEVSHRAVALKVRSGRRGSGAWDRRSGLDPDPVARCRRWPRQRRSTPRARRGRAEGGNLNT